MVMSMIKTNDALSFGRRLGNGNGSDQSQRTPVKGQAMERRLILPRLLPADYRPNDLKLYEFMQLLYFRKKLEGWKAELLDDASETITGLSQENLHQPDQMDRAQIESNAALDLRTRDRERKLLQKIESALRRIDDGSYGYCVETDEPISLRRLEARPIASLSLHAQERHERMERVHRDD